MFFWLYIHNCIDFSFLKKKSTLYYACTDALNWSKLTVKTKNYHKWQILSSAIVFNIDGNNVSLAANQLISMISEGSCDTEDWSNDAENTALRHNNKWHFNRY